VRPGETVEEPALDEPGGPARLAAEVLVGAVDRDAMHEGRERAVAAKAGQGAMEREEDVLCEVLALLDRTEDAREAAIDRGDMRAIDLRECVGVAAEVARHERVVVDVGDRGWSRERGEQGDRVDHGATSSPIAPHGAMRGVVSAVMPSTT
jgi:hypothetical protein